MAVLFCRWFSWITRWDERVKESFFDKISIKQLTPESQAPFIALADKILAGKKSAVNTQALEAKIDLRVYKRYKLTNAEVLVVEPGFGLSEAGYDAFNI